MTTTPNNTSAFAAIDACLDLGDQLSDAASTLRRQIERHVQAADLGDVSFRLLWHVRRESEDAGISQKELADRLQVSPAQTSSLVESLGRRGWIEAHRPSSDRRRQHWRLTAAGTKLLQAVMPELTRWAEGFLGNIGSGNIEQLRLLLTALIAQCDTPCDVLSIASPPDAEQTSDAEQTRSIAAPKTKRGAA